MDWEEEGKGRRGEGDAQPGEKIGQRLQLLSDFRFGFQSGEGGRRGHKGSVSAGGECGPFRRGWDEGFRGFWPPSGTLRAPPGPGLLGSPQLTDSVGTAAWRAAARQRRPRPSAVRLVKAAGSLANLPFKGESRDVGWSGGLL